MTIIRNNTNIKKETKLIKQMSESEQVSRLEAQIDQYIASHTEYANSIQTAKQNLTTAITNAGVSTSENDKFETMATNIGNILQARTSDATATAEDIAEGKTAWVNGNLVTGNSTFNIVFSSINEFDTYGVGYQSSTSNYNWYSYPKSYKNLSVSDYKFIINDAGTYLITGGSLI